MRRFALVVVIPVLAAMHVCGQQASSSSPREHVKVYANEPGVAPPQLLPIEWPPITTGMCKDKIDGDVELSLLVDTAGRARNIMFVHPVGNDADKFALQIAGRDLFKPGTVEGSPVVVAASLEIQIQSCAIKPQNGEGRAEYSIELRSVPIQKLGEPVNPPSKAVLALENSVRNGNVDNSLADGIAARTHSSADSSASVSSIDGTSLPVLLLAPQPTFSDGATQKKINGTCTIAAVIDAQGMPRNIEVVKRLDPGLDENAAFALSHYRFSPAMKDGEPVPFKIMVQVNFRLH